MVSQKPYICLTEGSLMERWCYGGGGARGIFITRGGAVDLHVQSPAPSVPRLTRATTTVCISLCGKQSNVSVAHVLMDLWLTPWWWIHKPPYDGLMTHFLLGSPFNLWFYAKLSNGFTTHAHMAFQKHRIIDHTAFCCLILFHEISPVCECYIMIVRMFFH